jgi:hypothetical protein
LPQHYSPTPSGAAALARLTAGRSIGDQRLGRPTVECFSTSLTE